jgi:hypothetical protein
MDLQVIILATLLVVVVMQLIILVTQQKNGKVVRDYFVQRAKNFQERGERNDRFRDRNNNNGNRQNRPPRADQDFKPRSPQAPSAPAAQNGAVDSVEKSLRDINLKLKNAERDQEDARRKIQDGGINGGDREPRRDRDNRGSRDGRDRDNRGGGRDRDNRGGRDRDNRGGRDRDNRGGRDRDNRGGRDRDNWRNRQDRPFQEERSAAPADVEELATSLPATDAGAISAPPPVQEAAELLNASDYDAGNTEHGRKISVKRPTLSDLPGENSTASEGESSSAGASGAPDATPDNPAPDAEISFGRR